MRIRLLRLGPSDHVLVLALDHMIVDGWSQGVLWRELATLYAAFAAGRASPLADLPIQYRDYVAWQRHRLAGATVKEQLGYWQRTLGELPPVLRLPRGGWADSAPHAKRLRLDLEPALVHRIAALGAAEECTPFMICMTAFHVALARLTGQRDMIVGCPIANRRSSEAEGLIGFFANTLPIRIDSKGVGTFRELLAKVRRCCLDAFEHQDVPLILLEQQYRESGPLINVVLNLVPSASVVEPAGLVVEPLDVEPGVSPLPLALLLSSDDAVGMRGALEYHTAVYTEAQIATLARGFRDLLETAVSNADSSVGVGPSSGPGAHETPAAQVSRPEQTG
jgi:hypothetical protein